MDIKDKLKIEGINFKGYGIIPKYIMIDEDLSIEAKTIYAYLCSYSGSGNTSLPGRDRILKELKISKNYYYKHLNELKEQGYILIHQERTSRSRFSHNVYTLVSNPKKFHLQFEAVGSENSFIYRKIAFSGLKSFGYGMIPKAIMIDIRLPLKAKGIYAYFCSHSGSGNLPYPNKADIINALNISESTYRRYFSYLVKLNYISVIQRTIGGKFSFNEYFLNDNPDEEMVNKKSDIVNSLTNSDLINQISYPDEEKISSAQIRDTEKSPQAQIKDTEDLPCGQMKDTAKIKQFQSLGQIRDTENLPYVQPCDTQRRDTIINDKLFINSFIDSFISLSDLKEKFKEKINADFWRRNLVYFNIPKYDSVTEVLNEIYGLFDHPKKFYFIANTEYSHKQIIERVMKLKAYHIAFLASLFYQYDIKYPKNYLIYYLVNELNQSIEMEAAWQFIFNMTENIVAIEKLFLNTDEFNDFWYNGRN